MSLRKILDLCQVSKDYQQNICNSEQFWRAIAQQRYGYTVEQVRAMNLQQLKNTIKLAETTYTPEEGLMWLNRIIWTIGNNDLNQIRLVPLRGYGPNATLADPQVQAIYNKKINFGRPLIFRLEDFTDFAETGNYEGEMLELELPAVISPMEIIGALANFYNEEARRLRMTIRGMMAGYVNVSQFVSLPQQNVYGLMLDES